MSAVFARSFHIEAGDDALCVVDQTLGDGALNAVLAEPYRPDAAIATGADVRIDDLALTIGGGAMFDARTARDWTPAFGVPSPVSPATLDALMKAALSRAPQDGAFRPALDDAYQPELLMQRALRERVRIFSQWLSRASQSRDGPDKEASPVAGLVGLGSGLTPAGDDFIGGAMIALRWRGQPSLADQIAGAIAALPRGATTVLSAAMLRAAAEGFGGATLHNMLSAIGDGDSMRAIALLDAIDRIGHTSGWDALAGTVCALRSSRHSGAR